MGTLLTNIRFGAKGTIALLMTYLLPQRFLFSLEKK